MKCIASLFVTTHRAAGRKAADGSDGFDVREAILQVLPVMRYLASADVTRQFSLSMNVLTPLFGYSSAPWSVDVQRQGSGGWPMPH